MMMKLLTPLLRLLLLWLCINHDHTIATDGVRDHHQCQRLSIDRSIDFTIKIATIINDVIIINVCFFPSIWSLLCFHSPSIYLSFEWWIYEHRDPARDHTIEKNSYVAIDHAIRTWLCIFFSKTLQHAREFLRRQLALSGTHHFFPECDFQVSF